MKGFIEFITDPAWWGAMATIVAAIVAAWITYKLGKRQEQLQQEQLKLQEQQNELQKRQTEAQEYELYRRMYAQIFELDFFNKTILLRVAAILLSNEDNKVRLKLIEDICNERDTLNEKFSECTIDIDLKKCGEGIDVKLYYDALTANRQILLMFKYFVENELLSFDPKLVKQIKIEHSTPPEAFINVILRLFIGSNIEFLEKELRDYIRIVEKINQAQLLKNIKDRITPNGR